MDQGNQGPPAPWSPGNTPSFGQTQQSRSGNQPLESGGRTYDLVPYGQQNQGGTQQYGLPPGYQDQGDGLAPYTRKPRTTQQYDLAPYLGNTRGIFLQELAKHRQKAWGQYPGGIVSYYPGGLVPYESYYPKLRRYSPYQPGFLLLSAVAAARYDENYDERYDDMGSAE